jgi:hypothetical protein
MSTVTYGTLELDPAPGWEAETDEYCATVCHPDGVGALQLSSFQKQDGTLISRDDLLKATQLSEETIPHLAEQVWGDFHGFQLVYSEEETFWRRWWLSNGSTLAFVTYNCGLQDSEVELEPVNKMLATLRQIRQA